MNTHMTTRIPGPTCNRRDVLHFPPMRFPDSQQSLTDLGEMMARGCGIVCVHYATGLRAEDVAEDGEHPLLHWMGGYFATACKHHRSIAN